MKSSKPSKQPSQSKNTPNGPPNPSDVTFVKRTTILLPASTRDSTRPHRPSRSKPSTTNNNNDRPPTEGAKIVSRPAATNSSTLNPSSTTASKIVYTEIGECLHIRDDSREAVKRSTSRIKSTKIPILRPAPLAEEVVVDEQLYVNPIVVPSSTTITAMPVRTQDEIQRLISGLRRRYSSSEKGRVVETEKKKEVHQECSNSVTKENSKTIENQVEENTEIITETIANGDNSKAVEKKTRIVKKTDTSTIRDTNFLQTIVRKSNIEVVTETKKADEIMFEGFI